MMQWGCVRRPNLTVPDDKRKQRLPRRIYETAKTLAAQFAPQGNQAERSKTGQGKCRTCIGNARGSDLKREAVRVHPGSPGPGIGAGSYAETEQGGTVIGRGGR